MQPTQPRWTLDEVPLLFPTIGIVGGIALCSLIESTNLLWLLIAIAVIAIVVGVWKRKPRIILTFLSGVLGIVVAQMAAPSPIALGEKLTATGEVVVSRDYGSLQRCVVEIDGGVRIAVSVYDYPYAVELGDRVEFSGILLPPRRTTTVADELDGSYYAKVNRLSAMTIAEDGDFRIVADATGLRGWLNRVRDIVVNQISYSGLSDATQRFVVAVVVGDDSVEPDVKEAFAHVGISHILALSGTHVSIVIFLVSFILLPIDIAGFRRGKQIAMLLLLWLYAMFTGLSPSVVRSVIMATFVLLGRMTERYSNSFNSLCGAALVILLFQPMSLFMPGFQLSFLAVAGILMIMPIVREFVADYKWGRNRVVYSVICWVTIPISAVIATSPLSAWHFHYFPVWFLAANLPIAILLPLILSGSIVMVAISMIGIKTLFLAECVGSLYNLLEKIVDLVSNLPGGSSGELIYFPGWLLFLIYGGMLLLWLGWTTGRKNYLFNGLILGVGAVVLLWLSREELPREDSYVWRHSRGVAVVCREGENVYLITDASTKYYPEIREQAEMSLVDYLGKRKAKLVDICGDSLSLRSVLISPHMWQIKATKFAVLRGDDTSFFDSSSVDYLIVARGFKGDIIDVSDKYQDIPLILSPSLPALRRKRYVEELKNANRSYLFNIPPSAFTVESR